MNAIELVIEKWRSDAKKMWNNGDNGEACGTTDCADELERLNREAIEPVMDAAHQLFVVADRLRTSLHDEAAWYPNHFDGSIRELLQQHRDAAGKYVAALARYREDANGRQA